MEYHVFEPMLTNAPGYTSDPFTGTDFLTSKQREHEEEHSDQTDDEDERWTVIQERCIGQECLILGDGVGSKLREQIWEK